MGRFEVVFVDQNHGVQWVSYPWREHLTVGQLIEQGDLLEPVSVYAEFVGHDYVVKVNDRLECTQPLAMDPKAARRNRLKESV